MRPSVQHTPLDPTKNFRGKHILFLFWPSVTSHYLVEETPPDAQLCHTHTHTYIHTYIHTYVRMYIQTYIRTYVRTYIHIYIYIHTYVHAYYLFTYFHTQSFTTSFVFPSFSDPATTFETHYWKKLTCGVIRSFNFLVDTTWKPSDVLTQIDRKSIVNRS